MRSSSSARHSVVGPAGRRGRLLAGERFAREEADHLRQRRLLPGDERGESLGLVALLERGVEIARHPRHAAGAERLAARLLERIEHRAGASVARGMAVVQGGIVVAHAQGRGIGVAAQRGDLPIGQAQRRAAQPDGVAVYGMGVGDELHLHLGVTGDRPRSRGGGGAELLQPRGSLDVVGLHREPETQARCAWTPVSGSSTPKQRW